MKLYKIFALLLVVPFLLQGQTFPAGEKIPVLTNSGSGSTSYELNQNFLGQNLNNPSGVMSVGTSNNMNWGLYMNANQRFYFSSLGTSITGGIDWNSPTIDNTATNFLMIDGANRFKYRSLASLGLSTPNLNQVLVVGNDAGGLKIVNISNGTSANDAINFSQLGIRTFYKSGTTSATSETNVLPSDAIVHDGKMNIGANETVMPFENQTTQKIYGSSENVLGSTKQKFTFSSDAGDAIVAIKNIYVNPTTGSDTRHFTEYTFNDNTKAFATLQKAIDFANQLSLQYLAIVIEGTTITTPLVINTDVIALTQNLTISAFNNYVEFQGLGRLQIRCNTLRFTNGFYSASANTRTPIYVHHNRMVIAQFQSLTLGTTLSANNLNGFFQLGANANIEFLGSPTINYTANNQSMLYAIEGNNNVSLFISAFVINTGSFTNSKLLENFSNEAATLNVQIYNSNSVFNGLQNISFMGCVIWIEGRQYVAIDKINSTYRPPATNQSTTQNYRDGFAVITNEGNIPLKLSRIKQFNDDIEAAAFGLVEGDIYKRIKDGQLTVKRGVNQSDNYGEISTQLYTSDVIWTKPVGAKRVTVYCFGGGGGGASGQTAATNLLRRGGCGGGGGSVAIMDFDAALLPTTVNLTIGGGGAGGAAILASSTAGLVGNSGGTTFFGTLLKAIGGNAGTNTSAGSGATGFPNGTSTSGGGGSVSNSAGSTGGTATPTSFASAGGGSGGGVTTANVAAVGTIGGNVGATNLSGLGYIILGGSAGAVSAAGGNGSNYTTVLSGGSGGGGGGASITGAGGAGGAGAQGGGGGGGGGATNGFSSGAGGAGGTGLIIIVTYF
jgi:hypothetical protein